jgi:DNA/RNA endonuclease G (NUC1)
MRHLPRLAAAVFALLALAASAADKAPVKVQYHGFTVTYDADRLAPVRAEYTLTKEQAENDPGLPRDPGFHQDKEVGSARSKDYPKGWDRGHLVPAENASRLSKEALHDSFSTVNAAPQNPELNRGPWRVLESRARALAKEHGRVDVVVECEYAAGDKSDGKTPCIPTHWTMRMKWKGGAKAWRIPNAACKTADLVGFEVKVE